MCHSLFAYFGEEIKEGVGCACLVVGPVESIKEMRAKKACDTGNRKQFNYQYNCVGRDFLFDSSFFFLRHHRLGVRLLWRECAFFLLWSINFAQIQWPLLQTGHTYIPIFRIAIRSRHAHFESMGIVPFTRIHPKSCEALGTKGKKGKTPTKNEYRK